MATEYARPVLCRLCRFPAPDGGVPVSQVDAEKLSEWCLRMMDTELDEEGLEKATFCQFCVWQARFLEENHDSAKNDSTLTNYLDGHRADNGYSYFFDELIQPCAVAIPQMSKHLLQKHNLAPSKPRRTNCIYCLSQLASKNALVRHVQEEHNEDQTFRCSSCNLFFLSLQEKQDHLQKFHRGSKFKCTLCAKNFNYMQKVVKHMKLLHGVHLLRCDYKCGAYFKNDKNSKEHVARKHQGSHKIQCIYCSRFLSRRRIHTHVRLSHKAVYIKCNFSKCLGFFHTEEERAQHVAEKHQEGAILCIYCNKNYDKRQVDSHMVNKHSSVRIKCTYKCFTYFHTLEERQKHVLEVHEQGEDRYRCIYCRKVLKKEHGAILKHMQIWHKEKAIKCDYQLHCNNFFLTQEEKQNHILEVHEGGEDKIRCEFCPRMVQIKGMLDHIRIHHKRTEEVDKVECIFCKSQMKQINLTVHMSRKHKTEAMKCNFNKRCGTYFKTFEDMKKHIAEVHMTGQKMDVFRCVFCKGEFSTSATLKGHMKRLHPEAIRCTVSRCWEYFSSEKKRDKHFEKVHALKEKGKTFLCTYCNFVATTKEEREIHSAEAHKEATVRCPECPKMLKSESAVKLHLRVVHGAKRECPHCKEQVLEMAWTKHLQRTSCLNCKVALSCRGKRAKHVKNCAVG